MSLEMTSADQEAVEFSENAPGSTPPIRKDPGEVPVAEIMTTPVKCARVGTSVTALVDLFLQDSISAVPIVDEEGTPMGVVSKTDLLERYYRESETPERHMPARRQRRNDDLELELERGFHLEYLEAVTVEEVMTPLMFSVKEHAPISRAAALMACENIHRVGVIDRKGRAVGIVSALDIMRWLARESGYHSVAGGKCR